MPIVATVMSRRREAQDLERALALSAREGTRQNLPSSSLSTLDHPSRESACPSPGRSEASCVDGQGEELGACEPAAIRQLESQDEAAASLRTKRPKLSSRTSHDALYTNDSHEPRDSPAQASHPPDERDSQSRLAQETSSHIPSNGPPSSLSPALQKLDATSARKRLFGKPITSLLPSSPSYVPGLKRHVRLPPLHTNRRPPPPPKPRLPKKEPKKTAADSGSEEGEPEPEIDYENEGFL
ncbi:Uncharacterized protein MSYG_3997 [Malassezia sympodialis ATCC 42132]|uniref:Uncharacterized protein n=1 Tax=Malassezia sympodialis (strain ATCC 42132) TaxID=1230383 RepID=A0A1M8AAZ4_MALS4|nr:Uncharacterized protein MSYG_3997 [Malassezia sympodialis ATCC 42132]